MTAAPPLAGTRVLDLTRLLPGNYATLVLAGLGADVIKVEDTRGGDGIRVAPPYVGEQSVTHAVLNRGKRSVQFDLKDAADSELFAALLSSADVLVDSFRPGVLERLGFDATRVSVLNPRLVHVSLTAYSTGARAAIPGHDLNAQALGGLLSLTAGADAMPALPGVQTADLVAALNVVIAVQSGLAIAARDGVGYRATVSMHESALAMLGLAGAQASVVDRGVAVEPGPGQMLTGELACYGIYQCADGGYVALGALEPQFFTRFCELIGAPELAMLQYDLEQQDVLRSRLSTIVGARPRDEWVALLEADDTCVTAVLSVSEALADPDIVGRGVVGSATLADGSSVAVVRAVPWSSWVDPDGAPGLGVDNDTVRAAATRREWPAPGA